MNLIDNEGKWYAVFVKTGDEDNVRERLEYKFAGKDLRVFVPKRKLRERSNGLWEIKIRSLFPGYVLINGLLGCDDYYMMKRVPGLIKVLRDSSMFYEIESEEMKILGKMIHNNEIIGTSSVLIDGGRTVVVEGPLLGLEGLIESIDRRKGRAKVRLNFIGESRMVDLDVNVLQTV